MSIRTIYAIESHEQALGIWRSNNTRNANILHVDFHCDQRGLLINRKSQRAFKIWTRFPEVDEGNFLKHAVLEGIISGIRWVHDEPGGRKDDIKSVKYESDVSAFIHRAVLALRRDQGIPIQYDVMKTADWSCINPGEILDIDWDFFAANEYPIDSIQARTDAFLSRDLGHIPEQTIVCYSPEYSHPSRSQFKEFVNVLATRFGAKVVEIPRPAKVKPKSYVKTMLKPIYQPVRQLHYFVFRTLRERGIY